MPTICACFWMLVNPIGLESWEIIIIILLIIHIKWGNAQVGTSHSSNLWVLVFISDSCISHLTILECIMYDVPMQLIFHGSKYNWNLNCPYTHSLALALTHLYHAPFTFPDMSSRILTHPHAPSWSNSLTHAPTNIPHAPSLTAPKPHAPAGLAHAHSRTYVYASRTHLYASHTHIYSSRTHLYASRTHWYASRTIVCITESHAPVSEDLITCG